MRLGAREGIVSRSRHAALYADGERSRRSRVHSRGQTRKRPVPLWRAASRWRRLSPLLEEPRRVRPLEHFRDQGKVVTAEAIGGPSPIKQVACREMPSVKLPP